MLGFEKVGGEVTVNSTYARTQAQSEVITLADGRYVVTWVDADFTDLYNRYLRAQLFEADGTPAGPELTLAGPDGYQLAQPSIAALEGGGFVSAWRDGQTLRIQRHDGNAASVGAEIDYVTMQSHGALEVTGTPGGGFAVAWID